MSNPKWMQWEDLETEDRDLDQPGVYMIAQFEGNPPKDKEAKPTDIEIIYIGEAHKRERTLRARLNAFFNVAFGKREKGHSGATTYKKKFPNEVDRKKERIRVVIYPFKEKVDEDKKVATIKYKERKLILKYVKEHRRFPLCNKE